jgi:protein TonB
MNASAEFYDRLDIIFANRNRAYGAYQLRRAYGAYMGRALAVGLTLIFLAVFLPGWIKGAGLFDRPEAPRNVEIIISDPRLEAPPKETPPPMEPPKPAKPTIAFPPPVVLQDDQVPEESAQPDVQELIESTAQVSSVTSDGDPDALPTLDDVEQSLEDIGGSVATAPPVETVHEMFDVNVPPTFGSGEKDLLAYLAGNIRYPELARENGIEGVVVLTFVVDKDGQVRDVKIVKDIGGGCGKEAVRVAQGMPRWRPGEAAGHPVKVRFTLPVKFQLK